MDTINNAREAFTDYRLRHPIATTALIVGGVLAALFYRRHRRRHAARSHSAVANLLIFWPLKITVALLVGAVILTAAGGYACYRVYPWLKRKWEERA